MHKCSTYKLTNCGESRGIIVAVALDSLGLLPPLSGTTTAYTRKD